MDCTSSRRLLGLQVTRLAHRQFLVWWPVVAGRESSHQSKSCFGWDDKVCKVLSARMGKRNPWRSCSVTPELLAVSRFNEEGRCSQGDYSLLEYNCPCIPRRRGGKLLAGDSEGKAPSHLVWGERPWLGKKKPGNSRPLPNE